jgi:hypothetical protein
MVLGASSYTYAEARRDQQLTAWISAHIHAFEYFAGVPRLLVPDNLRTGVSRACRYDPDLNPTYQEMAMHYGIGVVPARPYRPRDKSKVEVGVQVAERWIIAVLRHRQFFRLEDLNRAIRELLERVNQRPFRKCEGSRASVFAALERNALRSFPAEPFDMSQWSRARGEHRLPRRLRRQLLQRAVHAGSRVGGRASDTNGRSLPQGTTCSLASSWPWLRPGTHRARTSAEESPSTPGVDSLAHGELGRAHRTEHRTAVRTDPCRKAASGDGLSIVFGDHPARGTVLGRKDGSGSGSGAADRRLPIPEREIDPEELARPTAVDRTAGTSSPSAS